MSIVATGQVTLPSGLHAFAVQAEGLPAGHLALLCRGGPRFETAATWGLSHLVEHMVFRGAGDHKTGRALNLFADDFGGELQGATYRDKLILETPFDRGREADALGLLADMVCAPRFVAFETEKRIVLDEIASALDERGQVTCAEDIAMQHLFAGHPLQKSIDGDIDDIAAYRLPDVKAFFTQMVHPETSGLCIVSPHAPERALRQVKRAFAGWTSRGPALAAPPTYDASAGRGARARKGRAPRLVSVHADDAQTELSLIFRYRNTASARRAARLLARVLDDGPASRFAERIVDAQGLCYSLFCEDAAYGDDGVLHIGADVLHDRVGELVEAIVAELLRLRTRAPTAAERARIRRRWRRDERHVGASASAIALRGAFAAQRGRKSMSAVVPRLPAERGAADAVRALATDAFRPERLVLATVGTKRGQKRIRRALAGLAS